jgi:hypothetical protein
MKKEHLLAVAIAALAFFACSDDNNNSSDTGGCIIKVAGTEQYTCIEENQLYSKQSCTTPYEWVSNCPSGGSKCEQDAGGYKTVTHYYNFAIDPCTGSIPSSSSGPGSNPSSSSNLGSNSGSCYVTDIFQGTDLAMCAEDVTNSECQQVGEYGTVDFRSSCPSGYLLDCEEEGVLIHYYGTILTSLGFTCEDFLEE